MEKNELEWFKTRNIKVGGLSDPAPDPGQLALGGLSRVGGRVVQGRVVRWAGCPGFIVETLYYGGSEKTKNEFNSYI